MTTAEDDLITNLLGTVHVESVTLHWAPGLTVKVHLDEMNWAVRQTAISFVRSYCQRVMIENPGTIRTAEVEFTFPEPIEFSRATVAP